MMNCPFMQFSYLWLMRLTKREIEAIKETAAIVFGEAVEVRIFGSRTDDHKKGGDIDLLISGVKDDDLNVGAKIKFLVLLKQIIGDQKIDVLLDRPSLKSRSLFYKSVEQSSIRL